MALLSMGLWNSEGKELLTEPQKSQVVWKNSLAPINKKGDLYFKSHILNATVSLPDYSPEIMKTIYNLERKEGQQRVMWQPATDARKSIGI